MSSQNSIVQPVIQSRLNKTLVDKWIFLFNIPEAMKKLNTINKITKGNIDSTSIQFSLSAVSIPENTVKAVGQRYAAGNLYVSSHSREPWEPLTIKFNIDNRFANYVTISEWLNLLNDEQEAYPDANNLIGEKIGVNDYWTNLGVVGLDEYNNVKIMFTFIQAFPTKVSRIDFDYTNDKQIEVTANFMFSQMILSYPEEDVIK